MENQNQNTFNNVVNFGLYENPNNDNNKDNNDNKDNKDNKE